MQRPFSQDDLDKNKDRYERDSDILLRPRSSADTTSETPAPTEVYKKQFLADLGNPLDENDLSGDLLGVDPATNQDLLNAQNDSNMLSKDLDNIGKVSEEKQKPENILAMIFKMLPVGINIVKRGKTLATGFKELGIGMGDFFKNLAILTPVIGMDLIRYNIEMAKHIFAVLICSVKLITKFPKCVIFYIFEIIIYLLIVAIISVLFIFDVIFFLKYIFGYTLSEQFVRLLLLLEQLDKKMYSAFSFHIIHYPKPIIDMCYRCNGMDEQTSYDQASSKLFNDVFVRIPNEIIRPVGKIVTGVGHITSFLKI